MREERLEVAVPSIAATAVWTKEEARGGFDAVVYLSGYSYDHRKTDRNPAAHRTLYLCEPLSVYPRHFTRRFWKPFDVVLTWNNQLASAGGRMHYLPVINYDYPFAAGHGVVDSLDTPLPEPAERRQAICQIVGDKYSPVMGQLYGARRKAARWFHAYGTLIMDVYGLPAMNVPNYKGAVESKLDTLRQYRYALCFENLYHPVWSQGYVTEKIFDCMYADCVPVYFGACNIEETIPENCFIDYRRFKDFAELDAFLAALGDDDWLRYVTNIRAFLREHNAPYRYSCYRLYETVATLARAENPPGNAALPPGFLQRASLKEKAAYALMSAGLRCEGIIHPLFNLLRRLGSWRNR